MLSPAGFTYDGEINFFTTYLNTGTNINKTYDCSDLTETKIKKVSFTENQCSLVCGVGQYELDGVCVDCGTACGDCGDDTNCAACTGDLIKYSFSCIQCADNCLTCDTAPNNCTACHPNHSLLNVGPIDICYSDAPLDPGYVNTVNYQILVDLVFSDIEIDTSVELNLVDVFPCTELEYFDALAGVCKQCSSDCFDCVNGDLCLVCDDANTSLIENTCFPPFSYTESTVPPFVEVVELHQEFACLFSLNAHCLMCETSYFLNSYYKCEKCMDNCEACPNAQLCFQCKEGHADVDGVCELICSGGNFYYFNEQCLNCASCTNCIDCPDCSKCSQTVLYSFSTGVNSVVFSFDDSVILDELVAKTPLETEIGSETGGSHNYRFYTNNFNIRLLDCDVNVEAHHIQIFLETDSVLCFKFNLPYTTFNCYCEIQLMPDVVEISTNGKIKEFDKHYTYLKNVLIKDDEYYRERIITASKFTIFFLTISSNQLLNVMVFIVASTNIIDLFCLLQPHYFHKVYDTIKIFTISLDLFVRIAEDPRMELYYLNRIPDEKNEFHILENEHLNYIDLKRIVFLIFFVIYACKELLYKIRFLRKLKLFHMLLHYLSNFLYSYVTIGVYTTLYKKIILYKEYDPGYVSPFYLAIDQIYFIFIAVKLFMNQRKQNNYIEDLKTDIEEHGLGFKYKLKLLAFYQGSILFMRNFLIILILSFFSNNIILCTVIINIILLAYLGYVILVFISRKHLKNFVFIMIELFVIIILNTLVLFHLNPAVGDIFIYLGCVGISAMLLMNLCDRILQMMIEKVMATFK